MFLGVSIKSSALYRPARYKSSPSHPASFPLSSIPLHKDTKTGPSLIYGVPVLLSNINPPRTHVQLPAPSSSTLKPHQDKYFLLSSTQNPRLPKPTARGVMDSETREATLHVFPVFSGDLTHQKDQRAGRCAVPAAEETTTSAKHVAHHNSIMLSITSKSLINIHKFQQKLADLDMFPASRFPRVVTASAWLSVHDLLLIPYPSP